MQNNKNKLNTTSKKSWLLYAIALAVVIAVVVIVICLFNANKKVTKYSQLTSLETSEIYEASAKNKDYYYVLFYDSSETQDSDVQDKVLEYASLVSKKGSNAYSYRIYLLDVNDYANNHIVYSGDGVTTSIKDAASFDDIVVKDSDLAILVKFNNDHTVSKVFKTNEKIIAELDDGIASIKAA